MRVTRTTPDLHRYRAFFDGVEIPYCVAADDDAGWALCDLAVLPPEAARVQALGIRTDTGEPITVDLPCDPAWQRLPLAMEDGASIAVLLLGRIAIQRS